MCSDDYKQLVQFGEHENLHIYLQPGGAGTAKPIFPEHATERLHYRLNNFDLDFQFYPTDFTQVNPAINEKMVQQAIDFLELNNEDSVLDLYCGLGNFSLAIARTAKQVIGVEGSEGMVKRATDNAKDQVHILL